MDGPEGSGHLAIRDDIVLLIDPKQQIITRALGDTILRFGIEFYSFGYSLRTYGFTGQLRSQQMTTFQAALLYAFLVVFCLQCQCGAQSLPGILPFSTQDNGVDIATGNINIAFPLRSKNGKTPFWSKISSTSGYSAFNSGGVQFSPLLAWDYQDNSVAMLSTQISSTQGQSCYVSPQRYNYTEYVDTFSVTDASGAAHPFYASGTGGPNFLLGQGAPGQRCASATSYGPVTSTDNSGYVMVIANAVITIYDKYGNKWSGSCTYANQCSPTFQSTTDPDGTVIGLTSTPNGNGPYTYSVSDALGTPVLTGVPVYNDASGPLMPPGPLSYLDSGGNAQQYSFGYTTLNLASGFGCINSAGVASPQDYRHDLYGSTTGAALLTSISLPGPQAAQYTISYEPTPGLANYYTGRVAQITMPSGGSISYSYSGGNNGINCVYNTVPTLTVTVNDNNGNSSVYTYVSSLSTSTAAAQSPLPSTYTVTRTDPQNNQTVYTFAREFQTAARYYQGGATGTPLKTVLTCYNGNLSNCEFPQTVPDLAVTQRDIYTSFGSFPNSLSEEQYDANGNIFVQKQFGSGNIGSSGQCASASGVCAQTTTIYGSWSGTGCTALSYMSALPCDIQIANINNTGAPLAETRYTYNSTGHPTTISRLGPGSTWISSTTQYNTNGTPSSSTDPLGNTTSYGYTGQGGCNALLLTSTTYPLSSAGSTSQTWDCNGGVMTSSIDPNSKTTQYAYVDPQWRSTGTTFPDGGASTTSYNTGSALPWTTSTSSLITNTDSKASQVIYDGLARPVQEELTSDPSGTTYVATVYDNAGRVRSVSNPYRSTSDATYGITSYTYDAIGRPIYQCQPDNGSNNPCAPSQGYLQYSYQNEVTTLRDEAGNSTQRTIDALGRVTSVVEAGGQATIYVYDGLNNLSSVTQNGLAGESARVRNFSYDPLSRLTSSSNPETGMISYTPYDANGNLLSKTDARGVQVTYSYDAMNRLTSKSVNGTAYGGYWYDGTFPSGIPGTTLSGSNPNQIGRLDYKWALTPTAAQYTDQYFGYDPIGRLKHWTGAAPSEVGVSSHSVDAAYDLAGDVTDLTYPDSRHIQQTWNSAGRLGKPGQIAIQDVGTGQPYLQSAVYAADGSPATLALGNGVVTQTITKNNRLQVQRMSAVALLPNGGLQSVLSHTYCFSGCTTGGSANNGNIWGITDTLSNSQTQGFTYDSLNRIGSFTLGNILDQQYQIDSFGNMSPVVNGNPVSLFDPATNRINNLPCASSVTPYDAAGNQLCSTDQYGGVSQYAYDPESRISQITAINNTQPFAQYSYDPDGVRLRKDNANATYTEYTYFGGQPIAEKDQTGMWTDYIYAGGQKIAKIAPTYSQLHIHGVRDGTVTMACGTVFTETGMGGSPHVIQLGDTLVFDQKSVVASGGIALIFSDGTPNDASLVDQNGYTDFDAPPTGSWQHRSVDLSSLARTNQAGTPKVIGSFVVTMQSETPSGTWDEYFSDVEILGADGSVQQVFNGQALGYGAWSYCGTADPAFTVEQVAPAADSLLKSTYYYLNDHLGTAQLELASGGWPVYHGQFAPFGQELKSDGPLLPTDAPDGSGNHYKFTGKERDAESGIDYFGARYYASTMGRFMSHDFSEAGDEPDAVPYADLKNPQSLNLYSYGGNNPLSQVDITGHYHCDPQTSWTDESGALIVRAGECHVDFSDYVDLFRNMTRPVAKEIGVGILHEVASYFASSKNCPNCRVGIMPFGMIEGFGLGVTGTKTATTIAEKLALEAAEADPATGKVLQTVLKDPKFPAVDGWVKMESRSPGGVVVHWVRNTITGAAADFKLK